ncbi:MAG: ABC transporter ATP-binding protein [Hydrococcus sp. C42_A2020_068]|nr:ABC transporter ATP-binding protein [Hydrococcus sp. C42_A2020_068]
MLNEIQDRQIDAQPENVDIVISVENISKKFCRDLRKSLFYGVLDIATDLVGGRRKSDRLRKGEFWALKDVSFQLRRGEALGLVGANGAGKSTLLRIISGLIKPDTGRVRVRGRLAPLIALGAGFNPILTGRENVYANMSILGLSTKEINERFDAVVDFAEIGEAIDAPVQSYSSGMSARLGFASAIHTQPDILLIDEVLAVGDIKFKAKCYRRLHELNQQGVSFILVNHNTQAILNVCDSAIYLSKGQLVAFGDTGTILNQYEKDLFLEGRENTPGVLYLPKKLEHESLGLDLISIYFKSLEGDIVESIISGEPIVFCVNFRAHKKFSDVNVHLKITELRKQGNPILFLSNKNDGKSFEVGIGEHEIQLKIPYLSLVPGAYIMSIKLKEGALGTLDLVESFKFTVKSDINMGISLINQQRSWEIASKQ